MKQILQFLTTSRKCTCCCNERASGAIGASSWWFGWCAWSCSVSLSYATSNTASTIWAPIRPTSIYTYLTENYCWGCCLIMKYSNKSNMLRSPTTSGKCTSCCHGWASNAIGSIPRWFGRCAWSRSVFLSNATCNAATTIRTPVRPASINIYLK